MGKYGKSHPLRITMCLQDPTSSARLPCSGGENKGATGGAIRIVFDLRGALVLVRDDPDWLSSPPVSHIEMENKHDFPISGFSIQNPVPLQFPKANDLHLQIILGFPHLNALDGQPK